MCRKHTGIKPCDDCDDCLNDYIKETAKERTKRLKGKPMYDIIKESHGMGQNNE